MIKWFKKNWNEPFTVKTSLQMTGWVTLLSLLLVWPMTILMIKSFEIVNWFADLAGDLKAWIKKKLHKEEEDDFEN